MTVRNKSYALIVFMCPWAQQTVLFILGTILGDEYLLNLSSNKSTSTFPTGDGAV